MLCYYVHRDTFVQDISNIHTYYVHHDTFVQDISNIHTYFVHHDTFVQDISLYTVYLMERVNANPQINKTNFIYVVYALFIWQYFSLRVFFTSVYTHSIQGFSKYAKLNLLQPYKENCTIYVCYICSRS